MDQLICALPYLSYLTVCGARYSSGKLEMILQDNKILEIAKAENKRVLLRIYTPSIPSDKEEKSSFINSAILILKTHGYDGITLSQPNLDTENADEYNSFLRELRCACHENNLTLFTEGDLDKMPEYPEYSDHTVLTYDKLHLGQIPTFLEGEYVKMQTFADKFDSIRAFIELSSFAFDTQKYIPSETVAKKIIKGRVSITHDNERKIISCTGRGEEYVMCSLENTKSKLEAISELGFMGVSFDIMRTDIRELFLLCQMFAIASMPSKENQLRCDGTKKEANG